jgi:hypothetical protein
MLNTAKACLTEEELLVAEAELKVGQLMAFRVPELASPRRSF